MLQAAKRRPVRSDCAIPVPRPCATLVCTAALICGGMSVSLTTRSSLDRRPSSAHRSSPSSGNQRNALQKNRTSCRASAGLTFVCPTSILAISSREGRRREERSGRPSENEIDERVVFLRRQDDGSHDEQRGDDGAWVPTGCESIPGLRAHQVITPARMKVPT
jgi:hypothetical protein